ncbi:hypothetical protein LLG95_07590 [bacterium]|nr:hypothetical protein [bacterium]
MKDPDTPNSDRKSRRRFLLIGGIVGLAMVSILFCAVLVVAGRDLTRNVPTPNLVQKFSVEHNQKSPPPPETTVSITSATTTRQTQKLIAMIPDSKQLPDEVQKHRDEWNAKIANFNSKLEAFRREKNSIPSFDQFATRWYEINESCNVSIPVWMAYGMKYAGDDPVFLNTCLVSVEIKRELQGDLKPAYIRYGKWGQLAIGAEQDGNWDEAVYYWRQHGIRGQYRIVTGSLNRRFGFDKNYLAKLVRYLPYSGPKSPRPLIPQSVPVR